MNGALVGMSISSDVLILFPFLLYTLYFSSILSFCALPFSFGDAVYNDPIRLSFPEQKRALSFISFAHDPKKF